MPERPGLHFLLVRGIGVCLSEDEAQALAAYVEKLNEFEAARLRLLRD